MSLIYKMTTEQTNIGSIDALLNTQLNTLNQLKTLLDKELDAVKNRDGSVLVELSKEKESQLVAIQQVDQQISNHPESANIETNDAQRSIKDSITELLEECQTQNEVIYLTAKQNEVVIEQVKQLLIGGSKNTTYDAYGQKRSGPSLTKGIKA